MISHLISEELLIMPANHPDIAIELSHNSHLTIKPSVKDQLKILVGNSLLNSITHLKLSSNSNSELISVSVVPSLLMVIIITLKTTICGGPEIGKMMVLCILL